MVWVADKQVVRLQNSVIFWAKLFCLINLIGKKLWKQTWLPTLVKIWWLLTILLLLVCFNNHQMNIARTSYTKSKINHLNRNFIAANRFYYCQDLLKTTSTACCLFINLVPCMFMFSLTIHKLLPYNMLSPIRHRSSWVFVYTMRGGEKQGVLILHQ